MRDGALAGRGGAARGLSLPPAAGLGRMQGPSRDAGEEPLSLSWAGPVATTAYQTIYPIVAREKARTAGDRPPSHLDSCHALARDGAVVRREYPRWYTGPDSPGAATAQAGQKTRG